MSIKKLTAESSALLERVIVDSIEAQARHDAADDRAPARQDLAYLKVYYETRQQKLGYQAA